VLFDLEQEGEDGKESSQSGGNDGSRAYVVVHGGGRDRRSSGSQESGGSRVGNFDVEDERSTDTRVLSVHSEAVVLEVHFSDDGTGSTWQVLNGISNSDGINRVQVDDVSSGGLDSRGDVQSDLLRSWAVNDVDLGDSGDASSNDFTDDDSTGLVD